MEPILQVTKKDLRIDTFTAGGPGGQHQNKTETGVRITHIESGAVGEARDSRSQDENKRNAFKRMYHSKEFQDWLRVMTAEDVANELMDLTKVIRTYHFGRNQVTDHRTGAKASLKPVLDGDLDKLAQ